MENYYFSAENLNVGYDGKMLIGDIHFHLKKGEILTLIGPNGSGKSTILKSITRHLKKIDGAVYIDKVSMDDMSYKDIAKKLAVVLTERLKTELMTCWDLVATGRYPYTGRMGLLTAHDKDMIEMAMKKVQAYDLKDRSFEAISDGQRQRILLARAICQEPDIIVLDEPTSFLDVKHKLELLHILKTMAKENNITVIMSLHEIDLAQKISDKIMCVKGDRIRNYGSPSEIFNKELIEALYDIEMGSYNVTFGSVELGKIKGQAKLFVVAGAGTGIPYFRELQRMEIPFYTGILHENDIDYQIAESLATKVITEKAFNKISSKRYKEAVAILKDCQQVLYTGVAFGEINEKNRSLLEAAEHMNIPIIRALSEVGLNPFLSSGPVVKVQKSSIG